MATIIQDGTVITPTGREVRVLPHHSLVFDGGRVTELRPARDLAGRVQAGEFEAVIRADRHIVAPGLVNTHHHLYQSLTRCLPAAQNQRLFPWLLTLYERWRRLDYRAVNLAAKVSIAELLLHGATTTSDHFYMFPRGSDVRVEAVLDAAAELGIRIHLCRGSMSLGQGGGGLPPDDCTERDADVLADCERVIAAYHDPAPYALRRVDLAPCSPFNVTRELLRDTRALARQRGVLLHTHLAETRDEEEFCRAKLGCRPLRYLEELDWLGPDVYLAHCVWLSDDEIRLLAKTGTGVSLCPTSNMRLGSGLPPIGKLLAAGVRLGLGVDGSSSNDGGNVLAEAKQALLVARVAGAGDALLSVAEAFKLATVGGAACLGRGELGHLNPGAAADLALFRADDVALAGAAAHDPLAALVLCGAPRAERVFVAGREVVREGRIVALDETGLGAELNDLVAARFRAT
jgi:cytosine/adenosine deaminase-related metal-dependent hydrolase